MISLISPRVESGAASRRALDGAPRTMTVELTAMCAKCPYPSPSWSPTEKVVHIIHRIMVQGGQDVAVDVHGCADR
jgi:hypothetical protein